MSETVPKPRLGGEPQALPAPGTCTKSPVSDERLDLFINSQGGNAVHFEIYQMALELRKYRKGNLHEKQD